MKWKTQQEPKPTRHLTKSCFYLGSPVLLRQNRHTQRMKCNEFQMMSVFLNKVFHHHALLSLAKTGSAPARDGQWLCWVLVSHSKAWSWVLGSPSWMKSLPWCLPPQLLLRTLLQLRSRAGNHSPTGKLWLSGDPQGLWHHGVWCQGCGGKIKAKKKNHPILNRAFFLFSFLFFLIFFSFTSEGWIKCAWPKKKNMCTLL